MRRSFDSLNVNSELMLDLLFETNYSRVGQINIVGHNFFQISLGSFLNNVSHVCQLDGSIIIRINHSVRLRGGPCR